MQVLTWPSCWVLCMVESLGPDFGLQHSLVEAENGAGHGPCLPISMGSNGKALSCTFGGICLLVTW